MSKQRTKIYYDSFTLLEIEELIEYVQSGHLKLAERFKKIKFPCYLTKETTSFIKKYAPNYFWDDRDNFWFTGNFNY